MKGMINSLIGKAPHFILCLILVRIQVNIPLFLFLKGEKVMKITTLLTTAKTLAGHHAPEIYVGIGIGLSVITAVIVGKETPKALRMKEEIEYKEERSVEPREHVAIFLKTYWPALITGSCSIFLIISGQHIQAKRTAAATAAYLIAQDSLKNFTEKVTDELGEKKVLSIRDSIAKDKLKKNPVDYDTVINTGSGDTLCYDALNGRYFKSSVEAIRKAENEMNRRLVRENFVCLNEFFDELDLPRVRFGDELGWDVNLEGAVDIEFSSQLNDQNQPCLVIDSDICPRWHLYA